MPRPKGQRSKLYTNKNNFMKNYEVPCFVCLFNTAVKPLFHNPWNSYISSRNIKPKRFVYTQTELLPRCYTNMRWLGSLFNLWCPKKYLAYWQFPPAVVRVFDLGSRKLILSKIIIFIVTRKSDFRYLSHVCKKKRGLNQDRAWRFVFQDPIIHPKKHIDSVSVFDEM